ncbi:MAG: hypothetical protein R2690_13075 [Acidimicrobiales bacterium]
MSSVSGSNVSISVWYSSRRLQNASLPGVGGLVVDTLAELGVVGPSGPVVLDEVLGARRLGRAARSGHRRAEPSAVPAEASAERSSTEPAEVPFGPSVDVVDDEQAASGTSAALTMTAATARRAPRHVGAVRRW